MVVYFTYVASCLSMWYVTGFTVDRYIAIMYPLRKDVLCTAKRARVVVTVIGLATLLIFVFALWTSGIYMVEGMDNKALSVCMPLPHFHDFLTVVHIVDTAVNLVVPSAMIIILNLALANRIVQFSKEAKKSSEFSLHPANQEDGRKSTNAPTAPTLYGTVTKDDIQRDAMTSPRVLASTARRDSARQTNRRSLYSTPLNNRARTTRPYDRARRYTTATDCQRPNSKLSSRDGRASQRQTRVASPDRRRKVLQMRIRQERMRAQFRTGTTLIITVSDGLSDYFNDYNKSRFFTHF